MSACRRKGSLLQLVAVLGLAPGAAWGQPYVAAQVGQASADVRLGAPFNGDIDDRSLAYGLDLGYGASRHWAVELGASRFRNLDGRGTPCPEGMVCPLIVRPIEANKMTVYRLSVVPRIRLGPVRLFGKAGYYRANLDTTAFDATFSRDGLALGAGVAWNLPGPWRVSLEGTRFGDDAGQLTIGLGWSPSLFGD